MAPVENMLELVWSSSMANNWKILIQKIAISNTVSTYLFSLLM